jgi:hypothetical protein
VAIQSGDDGPWESVFTFPKGGGEALGNPAMIERAAARQFAHDLLDELIQSIGNKLAADYSEPE